MSWHACGCCSPQRKRFSGLSLRPSCRCYPSRRGWSPQRKSFCGLSPDFRAGAVPHRESVFVSKFRAALKALLPTEEALLSRISGPPCSYYYSRRCRSPQRKHFCDFLGGFLAGALHVRGSAFMEYSWSSLQVRCSPQRYCSQQRKDFWGLFIAPFESAGPVCYISKTAFIGQLFHVC